MLALIPTHLITLIVQTHAIKVPKRSRCEIYAHAIFVCYDEQQRGGFQLSRVVLAGVFPPGNAGGASGQSDMTNRRGGTESMSKALRRKDAIVKNSGNRALVNESSPGAVTDLSHAPPATAFPAGGASGPSPSDISSSSLKVVSICHDRTLVSDHRG